MTVSFAGMNNTLKQKQLKGIQSSLLCYYLHFSTYTVFCDVTCQNVFSESQWAHSHATTRLMLIEKKTNLSGTFDS